MSIGRCRCVRVAAVMLTVVLVAAAFAVAAPGRVAASCWRPPVEAPVSDPFRPPPCPWCPGNRGLEFATRPGDPVTAVVAGRVTFSGTVAGVAYVVTTAPSGLRVTYGRLLAVRLVVGDAVLAGTPVGTAREGFHLGLRRGDAYLDPAPRLGRFVRHPRLVPTDGSAPAPAPPPQLSCAPEPLRARFVVIPPRIR